MPLNTTSLLQPLDQGVTVQNKYTNYKGIKNNTNSGQITGIQEKLDATCKWNAS
jgi:hypothetical protein